MIRRVMSRRDVELVLCCSMVADDEVSIDRGAFGLWRGWCGAGCPVTARLSFLDPSRHCQRTLSTSAVHDECHCNPHQPIWMRSCRARGSGLKGHPRQWRVQARGLRRIKTQKKSLPISSWPYWHLYILQLMKRPCLRHCSPPMGLLKKPQIVYRDLKLHPQESDSCRLQWAINHP